MNLILFGFKGCGKTTLGKKLAQRLDRLFIDTDFLVEQLYFEQTGQQLPYREIFKAVGRDAFRALESDVLQQLKASQYVVIAVGGGLVLDPQNVTVLEKLGKLVYLKVNKETLKKRILNAQLPAFFDPVDPEGSFEQLYKERITKYEKIHAIPIDLENKTQDQIILELSAIIQELENAHG
jgi:shikimate kinase